MATSNAAGETPQATPIFTTDTCYARVSTLDDAEAVAVKANYPEIAKMMRNRFPHPYTKESAITWINIVHATNPITHFVMCDNVTGEIVGGGGLVPRSDVEERNMELGYWVSPPHWGKGYATSFARGLVRWGLEKFPDVNRIDGCVHAGNESSERVLLKLGFVKEGVRRQMIWKNGELLDLWVYGLLREDFKG